MATAGSTALRELESEPTSTTTTTSILWEIEPRLRVTFSHTASSSLNDLIYITDSIIPSGPQAATAPLPTDDQDDNDQSDYAEDEEWHCDCSSGCGVNDSDACDCVSTFGNFYTKNSGNTDSAGRLNLDALPDKMPLVECGPTCPCGVNCSNRVTQRGLKVPIHVKPMNDDIGLGAYYNGENTLKRGTFICLYAGEYLSTSEANERWSRTNQRKGEGNYILTLRLPNQRIHIDPRHQGNVGRFFNHSCDPTCVVQVVRWGGDSLWPRAAIFAKRDIENGEELTYDYADASGAGGVDHKDQAGDGLTKCLCGSENCRGWMPFDPDVK